MGLPGRAGNLFPVPVGKFATDQIAALGIVGADGAADMQAEASVLGVGI
jgi:hypothetical protein